MYIEKKSCLFYFFCACVVTCSAQAHVRVVDGDSLFLGNKEVRLSGIDAPEYKQTCFAVSGGRSPHPPFWASLCS